jgi:hypothetical protein
MENLLDTITLSIGIGAGLISIIVSIVVRRITSKKKEEYSIFKAEHTQTSKPYQDLEAKIEDIRNTIKKAKDPEKHSLEIQAFETKVEAIELGLRDLRRLLFDNPEAAVTIPLIKKDINSLIKDNERLRKELERLGGFTRWFVGIMITMSVGLLGLALSILLRG